MAVVFAQLYKLALLLRNFYCYSTHLTDTVGTWKAQVTNSSKTQRKISFSNTPSMFYKSRLIRDN